jgi:hypothetical protein
MDKKCKFKHKSLFHSLNNLIKKNDTAATSTRKFT